MMHFDMDSMQRRAWQPTYDQEGNVVTQEDVARERAVAFKDFLEGKRAEFEAALEAACERRNEVYVNMGFHPQVNDICYQIGMGVFTAQATSEGIRPVQVGQIGH